MNLIHECAHIDTREAVPSSCPEYCKGWLHLFQSQPLSARSLGRVQMPFSDGWIDVVAELRGMHVVCYASASYKEKVHFGAADVVAVLLLQNYRFDVVERHVVRVYFTPDCRNCNAVAYVQPFTHEIEDWRFGLGRAEACMTVAPTDLKIYSRIGVGGYGTVYVATYRKDGKFSDVTSEYSDSLEEPIERDISDGDIFAVKVIPKATILDSCTSFRLLTAERLILERARGKPYLLPLSFAFQTRDHVFLGMPLCAGGDLAAYLTRVTPPATRFRKWHGSCCKGFLDRPRLSEDEVRRIGAQLIVALQTLHSWQVAYRDLKPENVLLDENGNCMLGDFGLARFMQPGETREMTVCGTEACMSPETRLGKGSFEADVWSLGATLYKLLTGRSAFGRRGACASHAVPVFPCFVKRQARALLKGMLATDPEDRLSLEQLREHKFFRSVNWRDVEEGNMVALPQIPGMLKRERRFGGAKLAMSTRMWRGLNGVPVVQDRCWNGREARARDPNVIPGFEYGVPVGRVRKLAVFGQGNWIRGTGGSLPMEARSFLYS